MNQRQQEIVATRRQMLTAGAGLAAVMLARPADAQAGVAPAAKTETIDEAIRKFAGEAKVTRGKVKFDVPPLVENGNSVPVNVTVESPMTAQNFVKRIAIFNERNPQPNVIVCRLGPRAGRASIQTRMRLSTSQNLTAIAEFNDGSYWSDTANVIVTLAACTEDLL